MLVSSSSTSLMVKINNLVVVILKTRPVFIHKVQRQDTETYCEAYGDRPLGRVNWRNGVWGFGGRRNTWWEVSGKVEALIHKLTSFLITYLKTMNREQKTEQERAIEGANAILNNKGGLFLEAGDGGGGRVLHLYYWYCCARWGFPVLPWEKPGKGVKGVYSDSGFLWGVAIPLTRQNGTIKELDSC